DSVVRPTTVQLRIVVAIRRLARVIEDRPVRHVDEQLVGVVGEFLGRKDRIGEPEVLWIETEALALLDMVAAAKRHPAARMYELATNVVVLLEHEDAGAQIARADRGRKASPAAADDDNVDVEIPIVVAAFVSGHGTDGTEA